MRILNFSLSITITSFSEINEFILSYPSVFDISVWPIFEPKSEYVLLLFIRVSFFWGLFWSERVLNICVNLS